MSGQTAPDLSGIAQLYSGLVKDHGISPKSAGYKDLAAQQLRFEKLCDVFPAGAGGEPLAINELGCGYGAFRTHLVERRGLHIGLYRGYDISEEMLAAARDYLPRDGVELQRAATVDKPADYSFISGIFNVKLAADDQTWSQFIRETLLQVAAMSTKGFAFNLMSSYVDWKEERFYYADPAVYFDFCMRNISPYVSVLHDYPLYEWTMIVRKKDAVR